MLFRSAGASGASALCAFPLDEVDRLANRTRDACYTREGRATDGVEVAYIEYDVNSDCAQLPVVSPSSSLSGIHGQAAARGVQREAGGVGADQVNGCYVLPLCLGDGDALRKSWHSGDRGPFRVGLGLLPAEVVFV